MGINYQENPFPALCAVRAVIIACKLRYTVSEGLARYFVDVVRQFGSSELVRAQDVHYKRVIFREGDISGLEAHFINLLGRNNVAELPLPDIYDPKQMRLWED